MSFLLKLGLCFAVLLGGGIIIAMVLVLSMEWLKWDHKPRKEEKERVKELNKKQKSLRDAHQVKEADEMCQEIDAIKKNGPKDYRWERLSIAVFYFIFGVITTLFLGALMGLVTQKYRTSIIAAFGLIGAVLFLSALLEVLNAFDEKAGKSPRVVYAAAIYYGTFFVKRALSGYIFGKDSTLYLFSAIIAILICTIIWLIRKNK